MEGSFDFDLDTIDLNITKTSAGNYALGIINSENNKFVVKYVGRSDDDLNCRLKKQFERYGVKYKNFKYSYATSPKSSFDNECKHYHAFKPSGNILHPDRPTNSKWRCPVCTIFNIKP